MPSLPALEDDEALLLGHLGHAPCDLDTLCARAALGAEVIAGVLLKLELKGLVESLPGARYQRIR
jgi:DNA processing protein